MGNSQLFFQCFNLKKVNHQDDKGRTHLHYAVKFNFLEGVELLLHHGANPNIIDNLDGFSPLHIALINALNSNVDSDPENRERWVDIVKYLLDYGADPYAMSHNGDTALTYIVINNWGSITLHKAFQNILNGNYKDDGVLALFLSRNIWCRPMLAFIGGLRDESLKFLWAYFSGFYQGFGGDVVVNYYGWRPDLFDKEDDLRFSDNLNKHIENHPFSPLVVLGHSYGGASAHEYRLQDRTRGLSCGSDSYYAKSCKLW